MNEYLRGYLGRIMHGTGAFQAVHDKPIKIIYRTYKHLYTNCYNYFI